MVPLLAHAPTASKIISGARVTEEINACERDAFTGVIEFACAPDSRVMALFVDGMVLDAYSLEGEAREKVDPTALNRLTGELTVRKLSLPLEGVRMVKMLLEWHPPLETLTIHPSAIESHLHTWSARPVTSLVHIAWPEAEAMVILPGGVLPTTALFIEKERIVGEAAGLAAVYAHAAGSCVLTRYEAPASAGAEREQVTRLRTAFGLLVDLLLARYTELVGQSMSSALMFDLDGAALARRWRIKFTTNGLMDTQMFEKLDEARQAYAVLLGKLLDHMTVVIGPRLVRLLVREAFGHLDPRIQQALRAHGLISDYTL